SACSRSAPHSLCFIRPRAACSTVRSDLRVSDSQRKSRGRVYVWLPEPGLPAGGRLVAEIVALERLDAEGPGRERLWGRFVRVRNEAIVNEPGVDAGEVVAVRIGDVSADERGDFLFEPRRGGCRLDKCVLRREQYRRRYIEAARFGEVNTYYHVDRMAVYVHELLLELGAPPIPPVIAVVHAHHAAVQNEDGTPDGMLRFDRCVPFQGGHYRLPAARYRIREPNPIEPTGEIHLGPGWKLLQDGALVAAAAGRYRHVASHNAGTIYHEYGHHVTRHT